MKKYLLIVALFLVSCSNSGGPEQEYKCRDIKTGAIEFLDLSKNYEVGDTVEHYNTLYQIINVTDE